MHLFKGTFPGKICWFFLKMPKNHGDSGCRNRGNVSSSHGSFAKVGEDMHKLASHVVDSVAWNQNSWGIVREMMLSC